ncbi:MAG: DUF3783 domain-containing protein [Lachnospiraceae bacterium]|nr:DUF3783 domain-containing protein [Lachnospiraceae bacterium]
MEALYIHTENIEKRSAINKLCENLGIKVKEIGYSDLNRTVLDIVASVPIMFNNKTNINGGTESKVPPLFLMPEFILFNGFNDESLQGFLAAYRKAGIEKVALKAVVTPYNITWTLYDLIEHLKEESAQDPGNR